MKIHMNDVVMNQINSTSQQNISGQPRTAGNDNEYTFDMGRDTVEISDEARAILASKMQEYGVESPDELSEEQLNDLKQTMATAEGVTDADRAALAKHAGEEGPGQGGRPPRPTAMAGASDQEGNSSRWQLSISKDDDES